MCVFSHEYVGKIQLTNLEEHPSHYHSYCSEYLQGAICWWGHGQQTYSVHYSQSSQVWRGLNWMSPPSWVARGRQVSIAWWMSDLELLRYSLLSDNILMNLVTTFPSQPAFLRMWKMTSWRLYKALQIQPALWACQKISKFSHELTCWQMTFHNNFQTANHLCQFDFCNSMKPTCMEQKFTPF